MKTILNETHDEERAFYGSKNTIFDKVTIDGPLDGESAFKECKNIDIKNSVLNLRYPCWHNTNTNYENLKMNDTARAPFWYDRNITFSNVDCKGVKALRECRNVLVKDSNFESIEIGWRCNNVNVLNSSIEGFYAFFMSNNVTLNNVHFKGKYSFQYMRNLTITNSVLDTKDAFWHSKHVVVKDSTVIGEYLAWYASDITFINCRIIGTQPLCYTKGLKLINCTMEKCDLAFENTEVNGDVKILDEVTSIKNPQKGQLILDHMPTLIINEYSRDKGDFELVIK